MARRKRARTRTTVISSIVVCAVIIAAWMGYRAHAADNVGDYVTGTVTKGDVDQYLDLSGTISEENQSSVGFPTSGTVTSVEVALGDHVTAGEQLATMDDTQLKLAVTQAKAALAAAEDDVTQAQQAADDASAAASAPATSSTVPSAAATSGTGSQGVGSRGSGSQGSGSGASTGAPGSGSSGSSGIGSHASGGGTAGGRTGGTGGQQQLAALQQLVNQATAKLSGLQAAEASAVADLNTVCKAYGVSETPPTSPSAPATPPASKSARPSPSMSPSETPKQPATGPSDAPTSASPTESATTTSSTTSTGTPTPTTTSPTSRSTAPTSDPGSDSAAQLKSCVAAMDAVQAAQQNVNDQQTRLNQANSALTAATTAAITAATTAASRTPTQPSTGATSTSAPQSTTRPSGSSAPQQGHSSSGTSGQSAGRNSTMTVAEAEAAVTTAKINVRLAEQQLSEATITSPIAGIVASLDFAAGDSVSTSDKIVITGHGAMAVTVDVPGPKLNSIKEGQRATVGTDNSAGTVSSIGLLPAADSSSSDPSYPVTITVAHPAADLADGASAMANILISRASDVVQVPVSAVTDNGSTGTVTVIKDNEPSRIPVKIGAVGSTTVQITSGLSVGETIEIADRNQALPSADLSSTRLGGAGGQRAVLAGQAGQQPSGTGRR